MKTVDSGEFFHAPMENTFSEYKTFAAEQYFPVEIAKPPTEIIPLTESFAENDNKNTQSSYVNTNEPDLNDLTKRYNQLNGGSDGTAQTASTSSSSASQAAATGGGVSGSVGGAASSAAVGATSVTAVVVAVILLASSLFPFIGQLITFVCGNDFVAITLNVDSVIGGDKAFDGVLPTEFVLELIDEQNQNKSIYAKGGEQTYVFGGLKPNTQYTCNLVCTNAKFAQNPICYTDSVTTSAKGGIAAIVDTSQTNVTLDYENKSATVYFAAYVSDYYGEYDGYTLYVTDADLSEKELLFVSDELDSDNYFKIIVDNVHCSKLSITVAAQKMSEQTGGEFVETEILNYVLDVGLPEDWQDKPPVTVDETLFENASTRADISIGGKLLSLDNDTVLSAAVTQFNKDGNPIVVSEEAELSIDSEKMTFSVNAVARYGVKSFLFELFTYGDDGYKTVYVSPETAYECDQSFAATFAKVQPDEATLTYSTDGITVKVDPNFAAADTNCFYKLSLIDGEENLLDEYNGTGVAEFVITAIPRQINFVYAECATFASEDITYAEYKCNAVNVNLPSVSLCQSVGFDGDCFTIDYDVNTDYDLSRAQLVLDAVYNGKSVRQNVSVISAHGTAALEAMDGESSDVKVTATLRFYDNQKDGAAHELRFAECGYEMMFDFAVGQFVADVFQTDQIPVKITFAANRVPSSYKICVEADGEKTLLPVSQKQYEFSSLTADTAGNVSVSLVNADETYSGHKTDYIVNKAQAVAALTEEPVFNTINPSDAAVTFNQDGTVNVYRDIWTDSTVVINPDILLNARLVGFVEENGEYVDTETIDCFTNQKYAVAENIPRQRYYFVYYYVVKVGNIIYNVKQCARPSGSILDDVTVTAETNVSAENTVLTVNFGSSVLVQNKITVNGTDYTFDVAPEGSTNLVQVTLPQGTVVSQVTVYIADSTAAGQLTNLTEQGLQTKGSVYEAVTVNV